MGKLLGNLKNHLQLAGCIQAEQFGIGNCRRDAGCDFDLFVDRLILHLETDGKWPDLNSILFLKRLPTRNTSIINKSPVAAAKILDKKRFTFREYACMPPADIPRIEPQICIGLPTDNTLPAAQLILLGISSIIDNSQYSHDS